MIHGADYSNNQTQAGMVAHLDANPSIAFVLLKASQGVTFVDETRTAKAIECHKRGLLLGFYHYLDFSDGRAQWDHFESCVPFAPSIVACDYEGELLRDTKRGDAICRAFIARGQARGFKVGKYGSSGVSRRNHGEDWRWAAWWDQAPPPYPWDIWQSSGLRVDLDLSRFNDPDRLRAWWGGMSRWGIPQRRKVWYAHDPATGQTLGPADYLTIGSLVTKHLRTHPEATRIEVSRHA